MSRRKGEFVGAVVREVDGDIGYFPVVTGLGSSREVEQALDCLEDGDKYTILQVREVGTVHVEKKRIVHLDPDPEEEELPF